MAECRGPEGLATRAILDRHAAPPRAPLGDLAAAPVPEVLDRRDDLDGRLRGYRLRPSAGRRDHAPRNARADGRAARSRERSLDLPRPPGRRVGGPGLAAAAPDRDEPDRRGDRLVGADLLRAGLALPRSALRRGDRL